MLTKEKNFYNRFFALSSMIVLQNVIVLGVNLADNIMVGRYSEVSLSGVAAVNMLQFIFMQIIMSIGDTLVVIGSQYWGEKRTAPIKSLFAGALLTALVFGVALFTVTGLFPQAVVGIFTKSDAIRQAGCSYLSVIRYTYLLFAVTNVCLAMLRCVETVRISFYISISTFIINCSLNYCLIFGRFGFPALGERGAAIGTLCARFTELAIVIFYLSHFDKKIKLRISDLFHASAVLIKEYVKRSGFFILVGAMFGVSTALQTVILGHMNDSAIAANSISNTLFQVLKVASVGASSATAVIIGKTIGENAMDKLKSYVKTLQWIYLFIGILISALLFVLRKPVISVYDVSEQTKQMANSFLLVLCVTSIGTAYEMPVITGIIRGGGDSKFVFINDLISIWCIVLPLSFVAAFYWKAEPYIVIFCLNSDQLFKCIAAYVKVNRYTWIKKLTG